MSLYLQPRSTAQSPAITKMLTTSLAHTSGPASWTDHSSVSASSELSSTGSVGLDSRPTQLHGQSSSNPAQIAKAFDTKPSSVKWQLARDATVVAAPIVMPPAKLSSRLARDNTKPGSIEQEMPKSDSKVDIRVLPFPTNSTSGEEPEIRPSTQLTNDHAFTLPLEYTSTLDLYSVQCPRIKPKTLCKWARQALRRWCSCWAQNKAAQTIRDENFDYVTDCPLRKCEQLSLDAASSLLALDTRL
ncbi:hypothetical protein B0A50_02195 [Salinomyces thailandicus]|uniref:Uncharacterized protein n=1 Tax=Salinomyces thailandicus TaxID=706561 RepID=A0A4U0U7W9_9PEZI|nr:hypothetical protein B0A50_02195 [Salinomyces thailandica]